MVRIYSLKGLLLGYNLAFLLLILVTGAMGWLGVELRQQSAEESYRLNVLLTLVQEIRGDVYRQMTEVFDHHFLAEPLAVLRYRGSSQRIESKFLSLDEIAISPIEKEAAEALRLAYEQVRVQTNEIMSVQSSAIREVDQLTVFFTGDLEMIWLDGYEKVFFANDELMRIARKAQVEKSGALARNTLLVIIAPISLAALMLLASRFFLNQSFVLPVAALLKGFAEFGRGKLDYKVTEQGATELVELEKAVNRMAADLAESRRALVKSEKQAALGSLIPVVAHNIRNPLASIRATAQLHDHSKTPKEVSAGLEDIRVTIDRLEKWLSALLTYLNPLRLNTSLVSLSSIADESLRILSGQLDSKDIKIEKSGWISSPFVMADVHLLEQAIYGLLVNAVEASPRGGSIVVLLEKKSDFAILTIRDHGPGMPFQPSPDSLNPGPTTKSFGSGLGIPFAFKVIDLHNAIIEFNTPKNGGTEVIISLPTTNGAG